MSQTLTNQLLHCVFSTKKQREMITPKMAKPLYPYFDEIARQHGIILLAVGGMPDHIHLLISVPATLPLSKAMRRLKEKSSRWVRDAFPRHRSFAWQNGYGAFSIGVSDFERTVRYIEDQPAHHRQRTFEEEYFAFIKRNAVEYDEKYIFD